MTKDEIKSKAAKVIEKWQQAKSIGIHRDDAAYLAQLLADELHVAPPVDPEEVKGVG